MTTEAWPFAVTRGRKSGYQAIVVPGFLEQAGESYVIEYATRQESYDPGAVTVREVIGSAFSPLSLAYRVTQPQPDRFGLDGDVPLIDRIGRPIYVFEGLALLMPGGQVPSIGLASADLDAVTDRAVPAFRRLWVAEARIEAEPSAEISVGDIPPGPSRLTVHLAEPYVIPVN